MPRENQKRGRKNKRSGISSAADDIAEQPAVKKIKASLPEVIRLEDAIAEETAAVPAVGEWPALDPDSKAYWKQVDERILELEALGIGANADPDNDDEDGELL